MTYLSNNNIIAHFRPFVCDDCKTACRQTRFGLYRGQHSQMHAPYKRQQISTVLFAQSSSTHLAHLSAEHEWTHRLLKGGPCQGVLWPVNWRSTSTQRNAVLLNRLRPGYTFLLKPNAYQRYKTVDPKFPSFGEEPQTV